MIENNFEKILVETRQGTTLQLLVSTQGKEFALIGFDGWANALKARLSSKAEKGKANKELIREFEKIFSAKVEILSGEKSRQKKLLVKARKQQVAECLSKELGSQKNA